MVTRSFDRMQQELYQKELYQMVSSNQNHRASRDNRNAIAEHIIKSCEGLRLKAYICSSGMKTIGYGHVIKANEQQQLGEEISKVQADYLLDQDMQKARKVLYKHCKVPLNITQEGALISFIFNCGSGAFQSSALRQKLNRGEYLLAADEFLKWVYSRGVKLNGLVKRRQLERAVFLEGMTINSYYYSRDNIVSTAKHSRETNTGDREKYGIVLVIKNLFKKWRVV